ncbi:MAG TPA: hypothetical protein G4N94_08710, partial [Caldilineae bacterium]|nr:hypothetical protein [Caldilineae bacterium]
MTRKYAPRFISRFIIVAALVAVLFGLAQPSRAATITVAAGVVEIDGADGQCSLIEAIINTNDDAATHSDCPAGNGADVIELAAGALYEATQNNYLGTALPTITDELIIEGANATIAKVAAGNFRLMKNDVGNPLTIRDLIMEDGGAQSASGGAIHNSGHLTISNGIFRGNNTLSSNTDGGAIYLGGADSSLTVINSTFENNSAFQYGGAIYAAGGGAIKIIGSTFTDNLATNGGRGGAVYYDGVDGARLEVRNSTFTGNKAHQRGGAVNVASAVSDSVIAYSTFDNNESTNAGGGAVHVNQSADYFLFDHVTIINNTAASAGGGISGGKMHVLFSTIEGNSANYGGALGPDGDFIVTQTAIIANNAAQSGGAISISNAFAGRIQGTVKNSEISQNTAGVDGGAFRSEGNSDVTISHSTISGNRADNKAGGIYVGGSSTDQGTLQSSFNSIVSNSASLGAGGFYLDNDSEMTMRNTVLVDNTTDDIALYPSTCESLGTFTSSGYNRYPASAN